MESNVNFVESMRWNFNTVDWCVSSCVALKLVMFRIRCILIQRYWENSENKKWICHQHHLIKFPPMACGYTVIYALLRIPSLMPLVNPHNGDHNFIITEWFREPHERSTWSFHIYFVVSSWFFVVLLPQKIRRLLVSLPKSFFRP